MDVSGRLTVFFEEPFWVGNYELTDKDGPAVCRVVFDGEPGDSDVYRYFTRNWKRLRFRPKTSGTE